jgi:hypothetical protein
MDHFNDKIPRKTQERKFGPNSPNYVYDYYSEFGLENWFIPVTKEAVDVLHRELPRSREECYHCVTDEFAVLASRVYEELGCPELRAGNGWAVLAEMATRLCPFCSEESLDDYDNDISTAE